MPGFDFRKVAAEWKKASPKAKAAKDDVSKLMATFGTQYKEYDRAVFLDVVTGNNAKSDTDRNADGFETYLDRLKKAMPKETWSKDEQKLLDNFEHALEIEVKFWRSNPVESKTEIAFDAVELRKKWSERKDFAESKMPPGQKLPIKFDKNLGPLLDSYAKAKSSKDKLKYATVANQVALFYFKLIQTHEKELGPIPFNALLTQIVRVQKALAGTIKDLS